MHAAQNLDEPLPASQRRPAQRRPRPIQSIKGRHVIKKYELNRAARRRGARDELARKDSKLSKSARSQSTTRDIVAPASAAPGSLNDEQKEQPDEQKEESDIVEVADDVVGEAVGEAVGQVSQMAHPVSEPSYIPDFQALDTNLRLRASDPAAYTHLTLYYDKIFSILSIILKYHKNSSGHIPANNLQSQWNKAANALNGRFHKLKIDGLYIPLIKDFYSFTIRRETRCSISQIIWQLPSFATHIAKPAKTKQCFLSGVDVEADEPRMRVTTRRKQSPKYSPLGIRSSLELFSSRYIIFSPALRDGLVPLLPTAKLQLVFQRPPSCYLMVIKPVPAGKILRTQYAILVAKKGDTTIDIVDMCEKMKADSSYANAQQDCDAIWKCVVDELLIRFQGLSSASRPMFCNCMVPTLVDLSRLTKLPPYYECFRCGKIKNEGTKCCYQCGHQHQNPGKKEFCPSDDSDLKKCPRCRKPYDRLDGCNHMQHDECGEKPIHWCILCNEVFGVGSKTQYPYNQEWEQKYRKHYGIGSASPNRQHKGCPLYGPRKDMVAIEAAPVAAAAAAAAAAADPVDQDDQDE
jgi:hypothetical protein